MTSIGLDILAASPVFGDLPQEALSALAALCTEERYVAPTLLAGRGDRPDRLWHVMEGSVEIGLYSESGRAARLTPTLPGGWATWLACFQEAPLPHDLWTGQNTRLAAFPADAVRTLAVRFPQVYPRVIQRIGERMRDLIGWSLAASLSDPEQRLAYLLTVMARQAGGDGPIELVLTQDRIAAAGMGTRQRVARLLRALSDRGLIEQKYGRVRILSAPRLEAFAAP